MNEVHFVQCAHCGIEQKLGELIGGMCPDCAVLILEDMVGRDADLVMAFYSAYNWRDTFPPDVVYELVELQVRMSSNAKLLRAARSAIESRDNEAWWAAMHLV